MYHLTVQSYDEYQREMFKLMYDKEVSLTLLIANDKLWPLNAPLGNTHMIKELHVLGNLSALKLFSILGSIKSIQKLKIMNRYDKVCQNAATVNLHALSNIELPNMLELTLDEFNECGEFFEILLEKCKFENLKSFRFSNGIIFESNVHYIKRLINGARKTLNSLEFPGTKWLTTVFDHQIGTLVSLETLEIYITKEVGKFPQTLYFPKHFCYMFPNLKKVVANAGSIPWNQLDNISDCSNIYSLKLKLKVPTGVFSVDLSTFIRYFPNLMSLDLYIKFTNPDNMIGCVFEGKDDLDIYLDEFNFRSNCINANANQHSD